MLVSTEDFYIAELVQTPVLTAHYGESPYKTCLYGDFLNLYGGGQVNSIFTPGITQDFSSRSSTNVAFAEMTKNIEVLFVKQTMF